MAARLVQTVHGDSVMQLVAPRLGQGRHLDVGVLDGVGQLNAKHIRRNALINRHYAVMLANVILGLAPPVAGESQADQRGDDHDDADDDAKT